MALSLVFNPFSGTFDYVDTSGDTAAAYTPIKLIGVTWSIPNIPWPSQALFRRPILIGVGGSINIAAGSELISVL